VGGGVIGEYSRLTPPSATTEGPGHLARRIAPCARREIIQGAGEDNSIGPGICLNPNYDFAQVLLNFGWAKKWDSYEEYFGTPTTNTTQLHFPGLGLEAAKLLLERNVYGMFFISFT